MIIADAQTIGYLPRRDHESEIPKNFKSVVYCRIEQDDVSLYRMFDEGNLIGGVFWGHDSNAVLSENPGAPLESNNPPKSLEIEPSQYMRSDSANTMPSGLQPRTLGMWGDVVPCVIRAEGLMPIRDKEHGVDTQFAPKTVKQNNFTTDNNDSTEVKTANGAPVAKGVPGNCVSTVSQEGYELLFFADGNMLVVNHKNEDGTSTRVYDVKQDGFIDVSGKEAAALHTIFSIVLDENNRKVVCITGTKAGQDDTGFCGIKLDPKLGEGASVVPGSDNGVLCYGSWLKNGPFTAGAENDQHAIGTSADGKKIHPLHFDVDKALFFRNQEQDGPIKFSNNPFPVITEESEVVECELAFDTATGFWRIFANVGEQNGAALGRVRWNFTSDSSGESVEDFSEAEILGSSQIVWIDTNKSSGTVFRTAGDAAIFVLALVQEDFARPGGGTRDLYRVSNVFEDLGKEIQYVQTESTTICKLLEGESPFESPQEITTRINGSDLINRLAYKMPRQWINGQGEDFKFLEIHSVSNGVTDFYVRPIQPTPKDATFFQDGIMESAIKVSGSPIAMYRLDIQREFLNHAWNTLYNGCQLINVPEDREKSVIGRSVNTDESIVCTVDSYDENTGIALCTPVLNKSENPMQLNVGFKEHGKNSFIRPDPGQVEAGPNSYIVAHRVGYFNSAGGGSGGGENVSFNGPELDTEDATKVSFFTFFEKKNEFVVPVDIVAGPEIVVTPLPATSRVIAFVDNPNNDPFVDVGMRQSLVYNVIDTIPVSVNAGFGGGRRIIALSTTGLNFPTTDIRADCEAGVSGQLFSVQIVHGMIVDETGNIELVHVIAGPGSISFGVTCCQDDETTPPPDPPDPPDPPTEEPPPDGEETGGGENPDGTNTALFCPGSVAMELEDGSTTKILPRTAGGETGNCSYAFSEGPIGNVTSFLVNGNETGWTARIVTGFGTTTYRKAGGPNPFGAYVRDGAPTLSVRVF